MKSTPDSILIKTVNLNKIYLLGSNSLKALDDINLSIAKGEFLGLVGPSGSGENDIAEYSRLSRCPNNGQCNCAWAKYRITLPKRCCTPPE